MNDHVAAFADALSSFAVTDGVLRLPAADESVTPTGEAAATGHGHSTYAANTTRASPSQPKCILGRPTPRVARARQSARHYVGELGHGHGLDLPDMRSPAAPWTAGTIGVSVSVSGQGELGGQCITRSSLRQHGWPATCADTPYSPPGMARKPPRYGDGAAHRQSSCRAPHAPVAP